MNLGPIIKINDAVTLLKVSILFEKNLQPKCRLGIHPLALCICNLGRFLTALAQSKLSIDRVHLEQPTNLRQEQSRNPNTIHS